jgi:hypothetical protein
VADAGILIVPIVVIGAVYLLHLVVAVREVTGRQRREALMRAAAARLEAPLADRCTHVMGFVRGLPATFSLEGFVPRVEIDIPSTELLVTIRARATPAPTGGGFDDELVVEGAPTDVVRCLLGPELRAQLLECGPMEVTISGTTVEVIGRRARPADVRRTIELAAALAHAVPAAVDEADRRLTEVVGSPYRPLADATALRGARDRRADEVAALLETLRDRALAARRALVLGAVLAAFLAISLYASAG